MAGNGIVQMGRGVAELALIVSLFFLLGPMYNGNGLQRWPKLGKVKFYTKQELNVAEGWVAGSYKDSFITKCDPASSKIYNSAACACVRAQTTDKGVQQCLLNNDIPLQISDGPGFLLIVPLAVWFAAATSARMLCVFYSYHGHEADGDGDALGVGKMLRQGYIGGVLLVLLLPILLYNLTPNKDHFDAMSSALYFILFTLVTLVSTVLLSFETASGALNPLNTEDPSNKEGNIIKTPIDHLQGHIYVNWAFYAHILVSAPCIAVVMHILNNTLEFGSLCNTALLLCSIFALDGFSHFVAIYWVAVTNSGDDTKVLEDTHRAVALVKLFSWGTQAFLVLLFFITEYVKYPLTFDPTLTPPHAITAMVLIVLLLMNILPDIVREFMDFDYLNMISFRYYGDLILRIGVFWYIVYLLSVKVQ